MKNPWKTMGWLCVALMVGGCGKPSSRSHTPSQSRHSPPGTASEVLRERGVRRALRRSAGESSRPIRQWPLVTQLPLVLVDTGGQRIPDDPKITARLTLIYNPAGESNYLGSPHVHFEGAIEIEVRGKTSQQFPKKQYGLKLENAVSLLGMPAARNWILHGPYSDKTLMRNFLAYELSNRIGRYAPRTRFVEMILNDRGDPEARAAAYVGVYLLMERIERGPDRVRIGYDTSIDDTRNDPVFLMKIDKRDWSDHVFGTRLGTQIIYVYPKGEQANDASHAAEAYMNAVEAALDAATEGNQAYARFIDSGSFVDFLIINELFKNIDAYRLSTYFHKDRGGKLQMGPVWDFNLSLGNADYYGGWRTRGWLADHVPDGEGYPIPFWWRRLFRLRAFHDQVRARWHELRRELLADARLVATIDETAAMLDEPQQRNFQRWPVLGRYVWPNPSPQPATYQAEIQNLEHWMTERAAWMDQQLK